MEIIKQALTDIANDNTIKVSGDKIKQDTRNQVRNDLLNVFAKELAEKVGSELIEVERVEKGVAIRLDNENAGYMTILLDLKFVSLDFDMSFEVENYQEKLEAKAKAEKEKAEAKAQKIKADTERRARAKAESESD